MRWEVEKGTFNISATPGEMLNVPFSLSALEEGKSSGGTA
jgi:hypothetical protein